MYRKSIVNVWGIVVGDRCIKVKRKLNGWLGLVMANWYPF